MPLSRYSISRRAFVRITARLSAIFIPAFRYVREASAAAQPAAGAQMAASQAAPSGWSEPISSDDVVAIHAALVPTLNGDGEILLFGGDNHDHIAHLAGEFNHTRRFNCRHPEQALVYVQSPEFDLFCSGHAFLGDGRLLVAGGTAEFPKEAGDVHGSLGHWAGHRHAVIYDPTTGVFITAADMGTQPNGAERSGGRWYPTLCTLANGEVFAFQGHPDKDDTRHGNNTPERYLPLTNSWKLLPPIGDVSTPPPGHRHADPILYPRLHLLNDGSLFVSSLINGYNRNIRIDPANGAVHEVSPLPDADYYEYGYASVLLPLVPDDDYRPRVLLCGARRSQLLDLGQPDSGWQVVPRNAAPDEQVRVNACATLLPTGDVLLNGGARNDGVNDIGVMKPEIYRTPLNRAKGSYTSGVGQRETIDDPATVLRNYHSTALLMPDGRVWTAGGNRSGQPHQPDVPPTAAQKLIQIYTPPYPAGPRPSINACPSSLSYKDVFAVGVPNAAAIDAVVLMRCGSSTHAFNPDQRATWLRFTVTADNTLFAVAPPNSNVAPPGPYMLFVVDKDGRPCEYARFVHVGKLSDDGSRYAAIWVKDATVPFVARHDMTSQQYQQEFDEWVSRQGYALTLVDGYTVDNQDRYAAIWEKRSFAPFVARHNLSAEAYQHEFDKLVGQGYRLTLVSGYSVGERERYAAIWEQRTGPAWIARHGMTAAAYQREFDHWVGQGFRLKLVSGYSVGERERYAAIWEKDNGPAFVARHGMTSEQYQQAFDTFVGQQGYRLTWVNGYRVGDAKRYAAIWDQSPSPAWVARHNLSAEAYQHEFDKLVGRGYRLTLVSGY